MALDAGSLKHRITFQSKSGSEQDSTGQVVPVWENVTGLVEVPAKVMFLSTSEQFRAQAVHSKVTAVIQVRYLDNIDFSNRIVWGNYIFNIEGTLPDNGSGYESITLQVSQGLNNG